MVCNSPKAHGAEGENADISVLVKSAEEKGLFDDIREVVGLAGEIVDLFKSTKSAEEATRGQRRDMLDLSVDLRQVLMELPKPEDDKFILPPNFPEILAMARAFQSQLDKRSLEKAGEEKIGIAEIAAGVALVNGIVDLFKSSDVKSVEDLQDADEEKFLQFVLPAISIARDVFDLLKAEKGFSFGGVEASILDEAATKGVTTSDESSLTMISKSLQMREAAAVESEDKKREPGFAKNRFARVPEDDLKSALATDPLRRFSQQTLFRMSDADAKGVYGPDDRADLTEVEARLAIRPNDADLKAILNNARSICCVVNEGRLASVGSRTRLILRDYDVCADEPFSDQSTLSFCSGFVVGDDIVATAAHCAEDQGDVEEMRFVFGWRLPSDGVIPDEFVVDSDQVFRGERLLARQIGGSQKTDWALIQVEREFGASHPPLRLRRTGKIGDRQSVYCLGFPSGLPLKYAGNELLGFPGNSIVRSNDRPAFFVTNLDTYGGNSGSAVFNASTHEVEGILVRGGEDFAEVMVEGRDCFRSVLIEDPTEGRGEDVTRIAEVLSALNDAKSTAETTEAACCGQIGIAIAKKN